MPEAKIDGYVRKITVTITSMEIIEDVGYFIF